MIWRVPPWLPPNTKVQLWASLLFGPRHGVRDPYHAGRKLHSRKGGNTTGEAAACRFKHWRYVCMYLQRHHGQEQSSWSQVDLLYWTQSRYTLSNLDEFHEFHSISTKSWHSTSKDQDNCAATIKRYGNLSTGHTPLVSSQWAMATTLVRSAALQLRAWFCLSAHRPLHDNVMRHVSFLYVCGYVHISLYIYIYTYTVTYVYIIVYLYAIVHC